MNSVWTVDRNPTLSLQREISARDFVVALDFGDTKIEVATSDREGQLLEQKRLKTDAQQGCAGYLGYPFVENDGLSERMSQVASTREFGRLRTTRRVHAAPNRTMEQRVTPTSWPVRSTTVVLFQS
jgi:hypothetical protein